MTRYDAGLSHGAGLGLGLAMISQYPEFHLVAFLIFISLVAGPAFFRPWR